MGDMMRFRTMDGRTVTYSNGDVSGDQRLVTAVRFVVESSVDCGCNFWSAQPASLSTEWGAYLTICATLRRMTGFEPIVDRVPENPDGYMPEGPVIEETVTASSRFLSVED
jgi:hypothetical protein